MSMAQIKQGESESFSHLPLSKIPLHQLINYIQPVNKKKLNTPQMPKKKL